jgi:hypothetical protein
MASPAIEVASRRDAAECPPSSDPVVLNATRSHFTRYGTSTGLRRSLSTVCFCFPFFVFILRKVFLLFPLWLVALVIACLPQSWARGRIKHLSHTSFISRMRIKEVLSVEDFGAQLFANADRSVPAQQLTRRTHES